MKYIVDVKDISYGRIEVEAESVEEAQEKAEELYFSGMVPWADCDVSYEARPDYRAPAYYDRNGNEIKEGMRIVFEDGRTGFVADIAVRPRNHSAEIQFFGFFLGFFNRFSFDLDSAVADVLDVHNIFHLASLLSCVDFWTG